MMESRDNVQLVKVMLYCDGCGGRMISTGSVMLTYPPKYPHKCDDCGYMETCKKPYPYYEEEI